MSTSVLNNIIDGSITIDTPEAFDSIIEQYPENPDLAFMYANLLTRKKNRVSAAEFYEKATKIYIDSKKPILAIISKAHKWRLSRPGMAEIDSFFLSIINTNNNHHPFNDFLNNLPRLEKLALMLNFEHIAYPEKTVIKKPGEIENALFFVISGELKESFYQLLDHKEKYQKDTIRILKENDQFGNIYPYTKEIKSQSFVESFTRVQLAKISKVNLVKLCQKYPRIEQGLICLCNIRSEKKIFGSEIKIRKSNRYPIKVSMKVEILSGDNTESEFSFLGYSKDLSVTGVGFVLNECSKELREKLGTILERNEKRKITSVFLGDNMSISISGELVRLQEIVENGQRTIVLGIQFKKMPPNLQGLLFSAARIFSISETSNIL